MRAITIEADGKVAVMTENTKPLWEILPFEPLIKLPSFANLFAMRRTAAVDMVYGKKLDSGFTATCALAAVVFNKKFSFFLALLSASKIGFFPIVSCPNIFAFGVSPILFGILFGVCVLPSHVNFPITFLASHSQLVVSSGIFGEKFHRNTLFASIANSRPWNIASSIFRRSSIFLQDVLRFVFVVSSLCYELYHSM